MITIENLSVSFDGRTSVVDQMDLIIEDEKITVIIGESGSGKSVTISAILGILPKEATVKGSIKFNGIELLALSEREMNRLRGKVIGYVPQGGGNSMHPLINVGNQVAEPMVVHQKATKRKALNKASEWMDRVGLKPAGKIMESYPHTLSGGMRQRALIAMGAAGGADVLLADEPTKGLDDKRIDLIENLLLDLEGATIVCVTHDLRFAKRIADNVCVMYGGKVVEFADAESFFEDPWHPYSQMLLAALPENGLNSPDSFTPPAEEVAGCTFYSRCPKRDADCLNDIDLAGNDNHKVRCILNAAAN